MAAVVPTETSAAPASWCGRGAKPRTFEKEPPVICYDKPAASIVSKEEYDVSNANNSNNKII